jgi:uncharacterized protein (DUF2141 family)
LCLNIKDVRTWGILLLVLWAACAQQVPPSGGPVDKAPPKVSAVSPANNATLIPRDNRVIEFEFSERVSGRSIARALFITPNPEEDGFDIKLKGRKLRLVFRDSLLDNRTYVITLGTDLQDERGNALSSAYTLAFSTGATISNGAISGRVYSEPRKGILIWAYILENGRIPDPRQLAGDYATQTDDSGGYELKNLSEGTYRLFAIRDVDNNRFFEYGYDGLGVATRDVTLRDSILSESGLNFRVAVKDTIGPALTSVSAIHNTRITLRFDEKLAAAGVNDVTSYGIFADKGNTQLTVTTAYLSIIDPQEVTLITAAQQNVDYRITVTALTDLEGNLIDQTYNSDDFVGSALPDSFRPRIVLTVPEDSARSVLPDKPLEFHFDEAIVSDSFERHFGLLDSTENRVSGRFEWQNAAAVQFVPDAELAGSSLYTMTVLLDSVIDLARNPSAPDSLLRLSFRTVNVDTFATILGTVADTDSSASGEIFLRVQHSGRNGASQEQWLMQPGPYQFARLFPGLYRLDAFRDRDGNRAYTFGTAVPFSPAERFVVYDDSIKTRARWPNEGNDITLDR